MRYRALAILLPSLLVLSVPVLVSASSCIQCHSDNNSKRMEPGHSASCSRCHGGREDQMSAGEAHEGLIPNPAQMENAAKICATCHKDQFSRLQKSLMSTANGMINLTRYLWGAQPNEGPMYSAVEVEGMQLIPGFRDGSNPVDDLLRRNCLRCHLGARMDAKSNGGAGCSSCHLVRNPLSKNPVMQSTSAPASLTCAVPTSQCLRCHTGNRVGSDFIGHFERDLASPYDFEAPVPPDPFPSGNRFHKLLPDIHHERGLHCIDCHPVEEIMGDGTIYSHSKEQVGLRCTNCHGFPGRVPETETLSSSDPRFAKACKLNRWDPSQTDLEILKTIKGHSLLNSKKLHGEYYLVSKIDSRSHRIPILQSETPPPLPHRVEAHMKRLECSACHAAWTFQDLGFHLVLKEDSDYERWYSLTRQEDPQASAILESNLRLPPAEWKPPYSMDWLSGSFRPGVWLLGYSMRRWEGRLLGVNSRGLVSAMHPRYQYWFSRVEPNGNAYPSSIIPKTVDGKQALAWMPYTPHTTRKITVPCWGCHGNSRSMGLGNILRRVKDGQRTHLSRPMDDKLGIYFELDQVIDEGGTALQIPIPKGSSFLDAARLRKLSDRNSLYVKYLLQYYVGREAYGDPMGFTGLPE